ncbi:prepilin peptidase [Marimonas sp. MJW-29]|uniref:Prepilin peptidase n=1 Tax=Sulfitobacter sediminis TaxID=3234186 RepID=A0ABV3RTA0_9RHOB
MELLPLVLLSPLLFWVAWSDLTKMRIPNRIVFITLCVFVVFVPLLPIDSVMSRVLAALGVFAVGFVLFAFRMFGGGDVKILAALMLFIPPATLPLFGFVFSLSMLFGIGIVVTMRASPWAERSRWVSLRAKGYFPVGVAIALAGLVHPWLVAGLLSLPS